GDDVARRSPPGEELRHAGERRQAPIDDPVEVNDEQHRLMVAPPPGSADAPPPDPDLDLVELIVVDGDNLLHAVRGSRDAGGVAWLLPRLRAWRPPDISIIVALDGHADRGLGDKRPIAPGISVRHAGMRSAD